MMGGHRRAVKKSNVVEVEDDEKRQSGRVTVVGGRGGRGDKVWIRIKTGKSYSAD